jgi:polysaccharide deacetylase family protein (PEP-CTERM system associated)
VNIRIGPEQVVHRTITNAFTVDVEDYFQVEAFKTVVDPANWDNWPARVAANTERVLTLLKSANIRATFFVLGWVAERFPEVVHAIAREGHEVASHGYAHQRVCEQSGDEFREDVRRSKAILEDLCGSTVGGYRAPTFSIGPADLQAYQTLAQEGYAYSSSVYPISHDLYGAIEAPRAPFAPLGKGAILEIPLSTVRLFKRNQPCAGGGYFRLLPYAVSRWSINHVNSMEQTPCVFYCHPWEFDPGQARIPGIALKSRVRHYLNLDLMEQRVTRLLRDFAWGTMMDVFLRNASQSAEI